MEVPDRAQRKGQHHDIGHQIECCFGHERADFVVAVARHGLVPGMFEGDAREKGDQERHYGPSDDKADQRVGGDPVRARVRKEDPDVEEDDGGLDAGDGEAV